MLNVQYLNSVFTTFFRCDEINMPDLTFKWGRTDCDDSPYTDDEFEFPDATMTRSEMMTYFEDHFGYTGKEVVALMGAHTLGLNTLKANFTMSICPNIEQAQQ